MACTAMPRRSSSAAQCLIGPSADGQHNGIDPFQRGRPLEIEPGSRRLTTTRRLPIDSTLVDTIRATCCRSRRSIKKCLGIGQHVGAEAIQHFDDGHLLATLGQKVGGFGAAGAASNDDYVLAHLGLAGQHVVGRDDERLVGAGDGRDEGQGAGGQDDDIRPQRLHVGGGDGPSQLDFCPVLEGLVSKVLDDAEEMLLAGHLRSQVPAPAQALLRLVDGHVVPPHGGHAGGFDAGRAAADDHYLLGWVGRRDVKALLAAGLCIDQAEGMADLF